MMHSKERGKLIRRALSQWQLYLLLLPALIYLLLMSYMPMYGVLIAFKDFRVSHGVWGSSWVGLKHFSDFIAFHGFGQIMGNTIRISLLLMAIFPASIILALSINQVRNSKLKKTIQMVTYAPYFVSIVVVCSMITLFLNRSSGLINNVIDLFGGNRQAFLENPEAFAPIYVISDLWQGIGWGTIIYLSALSGVSPELVEAAYIDGAKRVQIIWHVEIPAIMPTIVITFILRCGSILSVGFDKAYLLQNNLNLEASQVLSTYVYEIGLQSGRFSYSAAIGLFNVLINVTMLMIVNHISTKAAEISLF